MSFPTLAVEFYYGAAWHDLASGTLLDLSTDRGRTKENERHKCGQAVLVFDNSAGTFDPKNNTNIAVGAPVRVRATTHSGAVLQIFGGTIDDFSIAWDGPDYSTSTIRVSDALKEAALMTTTGIGDAFPAVSGSTTGAAADAFATAAGSSGVSFGVCDAVDCRHTTIDLTTTSAKLLDAGNLLADGELGEFYATTWPWPSQAPAAGATYRLIGFERRWRASVATFSDNPGVGEYLYEAPLVGAVSGDLLRTKATVTRAGGVDQVAEVAAVAPHEWTLSGLWLEGDMQAKVLAEHVAQWYSDPFGLTFDQITLRPDILDTDAFWDVVVGACTAAGDTSIDEGVIDFGSRITVEKTPPYGSALSLSAFVLGVSHNVSNADGAQTWTTTLRLSPVAPWPDTTLILNDATRGKLDGTRTWG